MNKEQKLKHILEERAKHQFGHGGIPNRNANSFITNPENIEKIKASSIEIAPSKKPDSINRDIFYTSKKGQKELIKEVPITFYDEPFDIKIKNGTYINFEDFIFALKNELEFDSKDSFIVAWRTGEVVSKRQILKEIIFKVIKNHNHLKTKKKVELEGQKDEILNVSVNDKGKKSKLYIRDFLVNRKLPIEIGSIYVDIEELELALAEYIKINKVKDRPVSPQYISKPTPIIKTPSIFEYDFTNEPENTNDNSNQKTKPEIKPNPNPDFDSNPQKDPEPEWGQNPKPDPEPEPEKPQPDPEPSPNKNETPEQILDKIFTVILRKYKIPNHYLTPLLAALLALINFLMGLGWEEEKIEKYITEKSKINDYSFSEMSETDYDTRFKDAVENSNITIGQKNNVSKGTVFHESSDYDFGGKNKTGVFGRGLRDAGQYTISSISAILPNGTMEATYKDGTNLFNHAQEVSKKYNININEIIFRVHLTDPIAGWVDFKDIGNLRTDYKLNTTQVTLDEKEKISGTEHDFDGNTITIDNNGPVSLKVTDDQGNLLKPGTIILGSDGKQYKINEMMISELSSTHKEIVGTKKHLNFSFSNISKEEALSLLGLTALATALGFIIKKDKKEYANLSEEQINNIVQIAEARYESNSEFHKAVKTITEREINQAIINENEQGLSLEAIALKSALIAQEITLEQIGEMKGKKL